MDTWISLAAALPVRDLVVMGDGLVARRDPAASLDQLVEAVDACGGRRGVMKLDQALRLIRPHTDSAPETHLRLIIAAAGLPEPEVNGRVQTATRTLHGDLVFREQRVVVEYDGEQHRTDDRQFAIDVDRLDAIMARGWRVIRVDKHLIARRDVLLARLNEALTRNNPSS